MNRDDIRVFWPVLRRESTGSMVAVRHPTPIWMMELPDAAIEYWKRYYRHEMPGWTVCDVRPFGPEAPT